ncbi:MAG TPA: hypothetical protein VNC61_14960 [Acidimicrobiales bacterium]|nr:hypothetical protein [Acidimicrobiales bacterium]
MSDETDFEVEAVLNAYDSYREEHEDEDRQAEAAAARYDADFRQLIASVVRPYFEEVARQLEAHGHSALVEEGSVSSPDPRLAGGSKITLAFLPKERAQQSLRHQLELNDAPHFMLRCDKRIKEIELFQEPDPGFLGGGATFGPTWRIEQVTRANLRERILPMIRETLSPPGHEFKPSTAGMPGAFDR